MFTFLTKQCGFQKNIDQLGIYYWFEFFTGKLVGRMDHINLLSLSKLLFQKRLVKIQILKPVNSVELPWIFGFVLF